MARKAKTETTLLPEPEASCEIVVGKGNSVDIRPVIPEDRLKPEVMTIADEAKSIAVTSHASNEAASLFLKTVKAMRKKVADLCDPVCAAAHSAWKKTIALRDSLDAPLESAERDVKGKIGVFLQEQERLRQEEEHRKNCEAMKAAQDKAEQEAELLDAIGEPEAAEAVLTKPVFLAPVIIAQVAKPQGISTVSVWKYKIVDPNLIPREYLKIDEVKLGQVVRAMKEATKIPGVEAYEDKSVRVG